MFMNDGFLLCNFQTRETAASDLTAISGSKIIWLTTILQLDKSRLPKVFELVKDAAQKSFAANRLFSQK